MLDKFGINSLIFINIQTCIVSMQTSATTCMSVYLQKSLRVYLHLCLYQHCSQMLAYFYAYKYK